MVCSLIYFGICMQLWNHHHNQDWTQPSSPKISLASLITPSLAPLGMVCHSISGCSNRYTVGSLCGFNMLFSNDWRCWAPFMCLSSTYLVWRDVYSDSLPTVWLCFFFPYYKYVPFYCASLYCASLMLCFFTNWRQHLPPAKSFTQFVVILALLRWSGTEPAMPLRNACTGFWGFFIYSE